jgi:hypothetical protein
VSGLNTRLNCLCHLNLVSAQSLNLKAQGVLLSALSFSAFVYAATLITKASHLAHS